MIYSRNEGEVTVLGEVQKHKVGIDERNINHIVTILSSNLYSYPMVSFLRETVSNAVDSHVEAGTQEPIVIYRTEKDLSIRDFGTGISPERFHEIYLNIGSSTKRQSNDYIGSFGIGRFSCLSVSDLANITSYYEGKAYYYVMNKDIDQLHIDLMDVLDTKEHNGVDVRIPLDDWEPETLACLAFIDNIYVESEIEEDQYAISSFNRRKIHSFKTFKVLDIKSCFKHDENTEILLGKIPYKVDYTMLWDHSDLEHRTWEECFKWVYPQLEIGEVDITPNREGLLYSERTKEALRKAYDACIEELTALWHEACTKEYDSINEYMMRIVSYCNNRLDLAGTGLTIPLSRRLSYSASYKKYPWWDSIDLSEKKNIIHDMLYLEIDKLATLETDDTLSQGKVGARWFTLRKLMDNYLENPWKTAKVIALPNKAGFTGQYFKGFMREKFGTEQLLFIRQQITKPTLSDIKRQLIKRWGITIATDSIKRHFIIQLFREILLYLNQKVIVYDFVNDPAYTKYQKEHRIKRQTMPTEKICFTIWTGGDTAYKYTCTLQEIVLVLHSKYGKNRPIVYADLENPFTEAFMKMNYPGLIVIGAAKNKMPLLTRGLPKWIKPIESLYSADNRVLQKYAAVAFIKSQPEIDGTFSPKSVYPKPIRELLMELKKKVTKYSNPSYSSYDSSTIIQIVPPQKYDMEIMALWHQVEKWARLGYIIDTRLTLRQRYDDFSYYFLMKAKKFRMDWDFYNGMKECIKDLLENYETNSMQ